MCRHSVIDNTIRVPVQDDIFVSTESLNLDQNSPMEIPYKNKLLRLEKHEGNKLRDPLVPKKLLRPAFRASKNQQKLNEKSKIISETNIVLGKSDSSIEFLSLSSAD